MKSYTKWKKEKKVDEGAISNAWGAVKDGFQGLSQGWQNQQFLTF